MIIYFFCYIIVTLCIISLVDVVLMGHFELNYQNELHKDEYMNTEYNYFEQQGECECAAFSSAYLLRHLGKEAKGFDLYKELPKKYIMKNGAVYPKGVLFLLDKYEVEVIYCRGNLNALLNEVAKGRPVTVLIKTFENKNWLHYSTVVGYDREYIYLAESYKPLINCNEDDYNKENYNRRISKEDFIKLWNTRQLKMPLYKNTFYRIKENKLCE